MKKTIRDKVPTAYIAVNKNRQKIYGGDTVYLKKQEEFQIEFFNPCKFTVSAKITINGNLISDRALVIRSGDRGYLERYIDEDRKFVFDVYTVNNTQEVREAIEDNGDLKVEFYKEKVKKHTPINFNLNRKSFINTDELYSRRRSKTDNLYDSEILYDDAPFNCVDNCIEDNVSFDSIDNAPDTKCRGIADNAETLGFMSQGLQRVNKMSAKKSKKVETGRVEKGDESGQRFNEIDLDFESWSFHTVTYKLLPFSRQPQELKDVKLRCGNCNTKIKSGWKVCPVCATPIGSSGLCGNCQAELEAQWKVCPMCGRSL